MRLVHGDLKPVSRIFIEAPLVCDSIGQDNFRVTEDGVAKIIDLGLSRCQPQPDRRTGLTTTIEPSYRFIAPELIDEHSGGVSMSVTTATDVYAFSMTALQVRALFLLRHLLSDNVR